MRIAVAAALLAACNSGAKEGTLRLRSLTLYELGIGYYEREGSLRAGQIAEIPLEPGQVDDALKTLVIVSPGGVASVEYDPPLARAAAKARAGLAGQDATHGLMGLLGALRGVPVRAEIDGGSHVEGRVMEVETPTEGPAGHRDSLVLFGAAGLSRVALNDVNSVRPLDATVTAAWDRASASEAAEVGARPLRVRAGRSAGRVEVGYATEAPVWRTTYRLVLGEHLPRLQGFAIVHNDSDEAWGGVKVTLVSGRPTSFLFPLAGPRYGRRELVKPPDELETAPQLATTEAREHLNGGDEGEGEEAGIALGGIGTMGLGGGGGGYGTGGGTLGAKSKSIVGSGLLADGPTPVPPAAVSEAGDLFLYTIQEPVRLSPRHSALLPIVDSAVTGERVTVVDANGAMKSAVRFTNSTPLTLEAGVASVYTDGAFAGEAQIDRVKPKEVRVIRYGEDLDVEVSRVDRREPGPAQIVRALSNTIEIHRVDRVTHELTATSRSDRGRTLLVELTDEDLRVTGGAEEDARSPGQPRFARCPLDPRTHEKKSIVEEGAVVERLAADQLTTRRIDELLESDRLDAASRAALEKARGEAERVQLAEVKRGLAQRRQTEAEADLERLRASVESAGKGGARQAADALAAKMLAAEGHVEEWRSAGEDAGRAADDAQRALLAALSR